LVGGVEGRNVSKKRNFQNFCSNKKQLKNIVKMCNMKNTSLLLILQKTIINKINYSSIIKIMLTDLMINKNYYIFNYKIHVNLLNDEQDESQKSDITDQKSQIQ
jgi:hypothetical protein